MLLLLLFVYKIYNENYNEIIPLGEQDARVLTLAEQIIAAMPDRIKVK